MQWIKSAPFNRIWRKVKLDKETSMENGIVPIYLKSANRG